jgi:hypothetical protein
MPEVCHGPETSAIPGAACRRYGGRQRDRPGRQVSGYGSRHAARLFGIPVLPATPFAKLSDGGTRRAARSERCRSTRHGRGRRAGRSARMLGGCLPPKPREKSEGDHPITMVPAAGYSQDTASRLSPGPNGLRVIRDGPRAGVMPCRMDILVRRGLPGSAILQDVHDTLLRGPWSRGESRNIHHHPCW